MTDFHHYRAVRDLIVRPVLQHLGMHSEAAARLVWITGIAESRFQHIKQIGAGPALSWWQIEPETADWLWFDYLQRRQDIRDRVEDLSASAFPIVNQLPWNQGLACALCRVRYWTVPERLPKADDADGMGAYWKDHYNTAGGAGDADKFAALYRQYTGD